MSPPFKTAAALSVAALLAHMSFQPAGAAGHYDGEQLFIPEVQGEHETVFRDVLLRRQGTHLVLQRAVPGHSTPVDDVGPVAFFSFRERLLDLPEVGVELDGDRSYHDLTLTLVKGTKPLTFVVDAVSEPLEIEPREDYEQLQELLDQAVGEALIGVSLTVRGPGVDFSASAGQADLETESAMTPERKLGIGSVSKILLGATAAQMYDQGKLDLDSPITQWLDPAITTRIPSADSISLRHLLNHTSGIVDYVPDWAQDVFEDPSRDWALADLVEYVFDQPLNFDPGTRYDYSNTNYVLAGLIIEQVTGKPYYEVIRHRILDPLGLEDTFNAAEMFLAKEAAHTYEVDDETGEVVDLYFLMSRLSRPDAGMFSTPDDLTVLMRGLVDSDKILSEGALSEFLTPPVLSDGESSYGLGIAVSDLGDGQGRRIWHNGGDFGYLANLAYLEKTGITVALCANSTGDPASEIAFWQLFSQIVTVAQEDGADGGSQAQ